MYPGTIFNWHDLSEIRVPQENTEVYNAPLFCQVFSSDKGTEELIEIAGSDFNSMYGTMSFRKHGQSAIQAQNIIDHGGRLYAKRVVAEDSTLANIVLIANVSGAEGQVTVKWTSQSISGCKTFDEVKEAALELLDADSGVFPVFIHCDNGRGVSKKAVRLNPDYATSKTIGKTFYTLVVYEGSNIDEQLTMTVDPTVIYRNASYRYDKLSTVQITGEVNELVFDAYVNKLSEFLGIDESTLRNYDVVYGYTNKGKAIDGFNIDAESIDLDTDLGIQLAEGSNGAFGDAPVGTDAWANAIVDVFNGNFSDEIYDVDQHKISAIIDANYPASVKNAIYDLVAFRQDCVFLRDFGVGLTTYLEIREVYESYSDRRNRYTADYCTSYLIVDPLDRNTIEVTMLYDMASVLVNHFANNPFAPLAGTYNGFILENAIKGTVNFTPIITPSVNQKEAMEDIKVNYAIFQDDDCVVQSCYTSQEAYTQLSFVSNVIAIQTVLRAIRRSCPRQRFALTTGLSLQNYADAVTKVLEDYQNNFSTLEFIYTEDNVKAAQKIFYASIQFAFLNWAQTEIFDIYAINDWELTSTVE